MPELTKWRQRLKTHHTFVAEWQGAMVGFMTVSDDGYIDLAFVETNFIGKGVGKLLYNAVEAKARQLCVSRLYTNASHIARTFFEHQGWSVIDQQSITRDNVNLTNFAMEKQLYKNINE